MTQLLKTLSVWLLMALLPLHAAAAVMSMPCAALHQPALAPIVSSATMDHAACATPQMDHAEAEKLIQEQTESGQHKQCSACAAFCAAAAAIPSPKKVLPALDTSTAVLLAPSQFTEGFIPDGLQRPPRL